jgi:hypothetical protein
MSNDSQERRRFHRIGFDAKTVIAQGQRQWVTVSQDISFKGLLVRRPDEWDGDGNAPFTGSVALGDDIEVAMQLTLKHSDDAYLGFSCDHIDIESISHLRRIVELNLGDEALLERELAALGS